MIKTIDIFLILPFIFGIYLTCEAQSFSQMFSDILTEQDAQTRKQQIKSVSYELEFHFRKNVDGFEGKTKIEVELNSREIPLRIDATLTEIKKITFNGQHVRDFIQHEGFLEIPPKYLQSQNEICIEYSKKYKQKEFGLFYFKDPTDAREYIFTSSEPYGAHAFFPCFDQPDLKAIFAVTQIIPKDWVAISNNPVESAEEMDDCTIIRFKKTPPLSTYLLFIGCGDYKSWHSVAGSTPVIIYARQSMAKHIEAETAKSIFDVTRKGLDFFGKYFDYPYPFEKYDYIFSPELPVGGMENPGAVTISENMIFRGIPTEKDVIGRDNLILHEMAHMWFGDLVTMRWWEDLWLNESFATHMAFVGQENALGLGSRAWQVFVGMKEWAYITDQLITTHPIVSRVFDTDMAKVYFDGITYGKGAAVLKQLQFFVGPENFQKGVRSYFKKHQWKNASLGDFIHEIANASGKELESWSTGWLQSAGLNKATPYWQCDNEGRVSDFFIFQEPTVLNKFLPHRTRIGFFGRTESGTFELSEVIDTTLSGPKTEIKEAAGLRCPSFVYINLESHDYILVSLDANSLEVIKQDLNKIKDPTLRRMILLDIGRMTRERELKLGNYMSIYFTALQQETDTEILGHLLSDKSHFSEFYWKVLTPDERDVVAIDLEGMVWSYIQKLPVNSHLHLLWLDYYLFIAHTEKARDNISSLLNATWLDQKRRWVVIKTLSRLRAPDALKLVEAELKRDATSIGQTEAFAAKVAFPDKPGKEETWNALTGTDQEISSNQRIAASGLFHNPDHPELSEMVVDRFFDFVCSKADWSRIWYMKNIFSNLFPHNLYSEQLLIKSQTRLKEMKSLSPAARSIWLETNNVIEKRLKMRQYNENWLKNSQFNIGHKKWLE